MINNSEKILKIIDDLQGDDMLIASPKVCYGIMKIREIIEVSNLEKPNSSEPKQADPGFVDDTISRQAALDMVEESMRNNPHKDTVHRAMHDHEHRHFLLMLMRMPSAQPEITLEQIEEYCRPRCLSIITNDMLWHLAQRQPKQPGKWIPCSQKLPGEDKYVLICLEDDPEEDHCRMAVGWQENGYWNCWDDRADPRMNVIAWMPLPEAYKGGEDHETD